MQSFNDRKFNARRVLAILALASGLASQVSCLEANENHCLYQGGDAWCNAQSHGNVCVVAVDDSLSNPSSSGCYDALSDELDSHVHAKYGLPVAVRNAEAGRSNDDANFETVEGLFGTLVAQGQLDAQCDVNYDGLSEVAAQAQGLRDTLAPKKGSVRIATASINAETVAEFVSMNGAIDAAFEPCVIDGGTGTEGETETDGDSTTGFDTESSDSSGSTTTGPMPCGGNEDCTNPAAPFCDDDGVCVDCGGIPLGDEACAGVDPLVPLCVEGDCVGCVDGMTAACDEQLLVCDTGAMACVSCAAHGECASGACDLLGDMPTCFDADNVFDVGSGQMYANVAAALTAVDGMGLERAVLVLHEGADFNETAVVNSAAIAFVAADGQSPQWVYTSMPAAPTLTVSGADTRVYLDGIRLAQNANDLGLSCSGAAVDVRRSEIVANQGGGLSASTGCALSVENSFVGGDVNDVDAISATGAELSILYTTIGAGFGTAAALRCDGASTVAVRNSLLVARGSDDELQCAAAVTNSAGETLSAPNVSLGDMATAWFGAGGTFGTGDFHLSGTQPASISDAAQWGPGDPATDIDGDPRPAAVGPDYAGADVP